MNASTKYNKEKIIGIDCGVNTGIAIWNKRYNAFDYIETCQIDEAMEIIGMYEKDDMFIRIEDARLRKWFGNAGREQLQGAGSVKRDAKIWEDYLTRKGICFEMVAPKNNKTKLNAEQFKKLTGFTERTSVHARDAAMLVFGY